MYVCDDANECIFMKILRRLNISCTLHEMMVVLVQKINSTERIIPSNERVIVSDGWRRLLFKNLHDYRYDL